MSVFVSWPACWTASRWPACARNSGFRGRPATRFTIATRITAPQGLTDRSRRPYRHANQLPLAIETQIVRLKREYPEWGAPKIRERLRRRYPDVRCPAISTVHAVLDRHGLVERRARRRYKAKGTPLSRPAQPNALWCADFKGEFLLADRRYCFPLTITDFASRYLIRCEALASTKGSRRRSRSSSAPFTTSGCPRRFARTTAFPSRAGTPSMGSRGCRCGGYVSGIGLERIKPGHPEQNGRHERMHLTLKREATKPASPNFLQQQARFDAFVARYNDERPHQALDDAGARRRLRAVTATVSAASGDLEYPFHDWTAIVTTCGRICYEKRKVNLSTVFAGQKVGVAQVSEHIWLVSFMDYDLGYFDDETCRLEPIENPFRPKVLPMSPE